MASLCIDCGLCCDGTMYSTVEIDDADGPAELGAAGFSFVLKEEKRVFEQPCVAFRSGCCAVYEQRPGVCRAYRCALLRKHGADEITTAEAKALIAATIEMRDRVRPAIEDLIGAERSLPMPTLLALLDDLLKETDIVALRAHGELLLDVGMLRVLLMQNFEPRDTKLEKSTVTGPD